MLDNNNLNILLKDDMFEIYEEELEDSILAFSSKENLFDKTLSGLDIPEERKQAIRDNYPKVKKVIAMYTSRSILAVQSVTHHEEWGSVTIKARLEPTNSYV